MNTEALLLMEEIDQTAVLTLNRPKVMNCLNFDLLYAIRDAVDALNYRKDLRCVIFTGAGEKSFCAGADLKERATLPPEEVEKFILTIRTLMSSIQDLKLPVIAAVNGVALGGGTELALASDIRIVSETATMG